MKSITMSELQESIKIRQAVAELQQVRILFDALAEAVVVRSKDEEMAAAFYLLQDTFNSKFEYIAQLIPDSN